jgi:hypothetical protein
MALTKNNLEYNFSDRFLHTILKCKEKIGLLKVWDLLTESGSVLDITALFDTSDSRSHKRERQGINLDTINE